MEKRRIRRIRKSLRTRGPLIDKRLRFTGMDGLAIRWMTALAFGASLLTAVPVEVEAAGMFKKLSQKIKAKRQERMADEREPVRRTPQYRSYYRDAHDDAYINHKLLETTAEEEEKEADRKVIVDVARQRAYLVINGIVAIDTAVSTARRGHYTPRGTFKITERVQTGKVSTIYHVYMPNWMRLDHTTVGMHTGDLPGYPASAGCIRMPQSVAPLMFANTDYGVTVEVVDNWEEVELEIPYSIPYMPLLADASHIY